MSKGDCIKFNFDNSRVTASNLIKLSTRLDSERKVLLKALTKKYDTNYASINVLDDKSILSSSKKVLAKVKTASTIVVIGIGGSNLGTIAVYEALKDKLHNELEKKKIYFADTSDAYEIQNISLLISKELKAKRKVVLNVVSKSGGTAETIANFEILLEILKQFKKKNYNEYVVLTTDKNSKLWDLGLEKKYHLLEIPKLVGGRYSVFSNVGIFPLMFLGIKVQKLIAGAKDMRELCLEKNFNKNPAMKSAGIIYNNNKTGKIIFNTFLFINQLESIGKWYRQLMGESIAKEFDLKGKKVNTGITPSVAIGSTDLHSLAQLYLAGPNNKLHLFVKVENLPPLKLPTYKKFDNIVEHIQGRDLSTIMIAILKGTQEAFTKKKIPFYEISLNKLDEHCIGALLQLKMFEMIYLAALLNVNPFDQPNVEEYKLVTKRILKNNK